MRLAKAARVNHNRVNRKWGAGMYVIYLLAASVVGALAQVLIWGEPLFATLLKWLLVFNSGLGGIWAFLGHYFKSDEIAAYIGWPAGNPFQKEIAFGNLAMGVSGVMCFFFGPDFWLATMVVASVFLLGAFSVHVQEQKKTGNKQPGNAGPVFYADIVYPASLWVCYLLMRLTA